MKIRTQIRCEIAKDTKWCINFVDDTNNLVSLCAIPPTKGDRVDAISQTNHIAKYGGLCYNTQYIYDYQGNLKKLKGEQIIIRIKSGEVKLEYKKK